MKTSNVCWTCRLRRKKCDESKPICGACGTLEITCHSQEEIKPEWMDGGLKQAEMSDRIKRDIKIKAHRRRGSSMFETSSEFMITPGNLSKLQADTAPRLPADAISNGSDPTKSSAETPGPQVQLRPERKHDSHNALQSLVLEGSDAVHSLFYLEKVHPFLFPFYNPSYQQGGKAWILELIMKWPAFR